MYRTSKYFINKNNFNLETVKNTIKEYCVNNDIEILRLVIKDKDSINESLYYEVYGEISKLNKIKEFINVMNFNK